MTSNSVGQAMATAAPDNHSDNDLASEPIAPRANFHITSGVYYEANGKSENSAWHSHVNNPETELVNQSALTEKVPRNLSGSLEKIIKSRACCNLFCDCTSPENSKPIPIRVTHRKKLFPSFSHPDTSFVFTDEDLIIDKSRHTSVSREEPLASPVNNRRSWRRRDPQLELPMKSSRRKEIINDHRKKFSIFKSHSESERDEEEYAVDRQDGFTIVAVHPEIAVKVQNPLEVNSEPSACRKYSQLKICRSESDAEYSPSEGKAISDPAPVNYMDQSGVAVSSDNEINVDSTLNNLPAHQTPDNNGDDSKVLLAAQKFFLESGILGPPVAMGNGIFRKSSKVNIIDNLQFEQIRKHSRTIHRAETKTAIRNNEALAFGITSSPMSSDKHDEELSNLRELLKKRESEIHRLKREIHKLKSVLQQTTEAPIETDLISRLPTPYHCTTNQQLIANKTIFATSPRPEMSGSENALSSSCKSDYLSTYSNIFTSNNPSSVAKKQGVSAECSENKQYTFKDFRIEVHEKDFKAKQLIKDAICDNDFLKHLASGQIKELVESMYQKEIFAGDFVIKEGETGSHLYVSDEGEFEVIKDNVVLGKMGPGKAFGELAILYNCTRTASIRALSDSKLWVLDRRVFQHIMMRTGMQKIEENINFLRSVPLLKNLGIDGLAKIADVLELEFYPTGTYIIRQDTKGDSFFLISQGNVKVTQRLPGTKIEEEIRILGRGDYFGEQALIKEDKRTANIVAVDPGVECLTLDRESFRKFIGDLSELHDIDYGDDDRATSFKENEREILAFSKANKQQLLHINLSDLEIVSTLGIGGFGRVELVRYCNPQRDTETQTYALKCLKKKHILETKQEEHVFNERTIMMSCESNFICRLYRTYRDDKYVYMLMEACLGGEIWTMLRNRGYFDEYSGQFIISCVLEAFKYLHSRGIVFRDLKPENLILGANGYVKLVDFGFAKYIGFSSKTWTFCGTPEYVAPEIILNKGHDRAVDYWALGILVYELLSGAPPFTSTDPMKTYNIILKNVMEFPPHITKTAINFIRRLCRDVPAERLGYQRGGIEEIKKHKWFQGFDFDGLEIQTLASPILNPVASAIDTSHFDCFPMDTDVPPDEYSGWDADF